MAQTVDRSVVGLIFIFCSAVFTSATVHTVGDARGWNLGVDYSTWTSGKIFAVGDMLVFKYNRGLHSVAEVSARDYQSCSAASSISTDSSGSTTIALKTAGTHYFVCPVPPHCRAGMKLAVAVGGSKTEGRTGSFTPP